MIASSTCLKRVKLCPAKPALRQEGNLVEESDFSKMTVPHLRQPGKADKFASLFSKTVCIVCVLRDDAMDFYYTPLHVLLLIVC